eukprot:284816954_6
MGRSSRECRYRCTYPASNAAMRLHWRACRRRWVGCSNSSSNMREAYMDEFVSFTGSPTKLVHSNLRHHLALVKGRISDLRPVASPLRFMTNGMTVRLLMEDNAKASLLLSLYGLHWIYSFNGSRQTYGDISSDFSATDVVKLCSASGCRGHRVPCIGIYRRCMRLCLTNSRPADSGSCGCWAQISRFVRDLRVEISVVSVNHTYISFSLTGSSVARGTPFWYILAPTVQYESAFYQLPPAQNGVNQAVSSPQISSLTSQLTFPSTVSPASTRGSPTVLLSPSDSQASSRPTAGEDEKEMLIVLICYTPMQFSHGANLPQSLPVIHKATRGSFTAGDLHDLVAKEKFDVPEVESEEASTPAISFWGSASSKMFSVPNDRSVLLDPFVRDQQTQPAPMMTVGYNDGEGASLVEIGFLRQLWPGAQQYVVNRKQIRDVFVRAAYVGHTFSCGISECANIVQTNLVSAHFAFSGAVSLEEKLGSRLRCTAPGSMARRGIDLASLFGLQKEGQLGITDSQRLMLKSCWRLLAHERHFQFGSQNEDGHHLSARREVNLLDCLAEFQREEQLGPDNMWFCNRCKEHRQAKKKIDVWKLPKVLIIHLKRFSQSRCSFYQLLFLPGAHSLHAVLLFPSFVVLLFFSRLLPSVLFHMMRRWDKPVWLSPASCSSHCFLPVLPLKEQRESFVQRIRATRFGSSNSRSAFRGFALRALRVFQPHGKSGRRSLYCYRKVPSGRRSRSFVVSVLKYFPARAPRQLVCRSSRKCLLVFSIALCTAAIAACAGWNLMILTSPPLPTTACVEPMRTCCFTSEWIAGRRKHLYAARLLDRRTNSSARLERSWQIYITLCVNMINMRHFKQHHLESFYEQAIAIYGYPPALVRRCLSDCNDSMELHTENARVWRHMCVYKAQ